MGRPTTPGKPRAARPGGYALLILLFAFTIMAFGLIVAVPVYETQIQREKEAELIFRGKQYVEAIRIFQTKNPGAFPKTLEDLVKDEDKKYIRRLFRDPMTPDGKWNVILHQEGFGGQGSGLSGPGRGPALRPGGVPPMAVRSTVGATKVMVAPVSALDAIDNPRILGVVSSSTRKSIRIYNDQESYDKWLFFLGQDPKNLPEIVYYGESDKKS